MSRHNMAQTIPTHASGFQLFTVAMTGHAEERGSATAAKGSSIVVVLMQQIRAVPREWDFIRMLYGGLLSWHF